VLVAGSNAELGVGPLDPYGVTGNSPTNGDHDCDRSHRPGGAAA
jgi:hypothetical protein